VDKLQLKSGLRRAANQIGQPASQKKRVQHNLIANFGRICLARARAKVLFVGRDWQ